MKTKSERSSQTGRQVLFLDPITDRRWSTLIQKQTSLVFHSPEWLNLVSRTYGFPVSAAVLFEGVKPRAGLPFAVIEDAIGKRLAGFAFSDFCDPVLSKSSELTPLLAAIIKTFPEHQFNFRPVNGPGPHPRFNFQLVRTARWHGLPLEGSEKNLWDQLHPEFRRAVRRAQKNGVTVAPMKKSELRNFYALHLRVRKHRYRLLAQPYSFFANLYQDFIPGKKGLFLGAYQDGRLLAAQGLLFWKDTLIYKFGASDYAAADARANHLLHWEGVRLGISRGFKLFDLGLSDDDQEGLIRYKQHLGGREKVIRFLRHSPPGYLAPGEDFRALLTEFTRLATEPAVPDSVTEQIGNALYRYFV